MSPFTIKIPMYKVFKLDLKRSACNNSFFCQNCTFLVTDCSYKEAKSLDVCIPILESYICILNLHIHNPSLATLHIYTCDVRRKRKK